jgi:putative two-component system response regulator
VVLAVDDDEDLVALIARALGSEYQMLTATNPGDAIVLAGGEPRPDMILLDIEMPDVSGFEVCQALKSEAATADIPVIFLTGKAEAEAQVEAFGLGAADYILKPVNSGVLKARVRMHLALADQRHALEQLVRERTAEVERARNEIIRRLGRAMELHESAAVGNRVIRLGHYARLIAQAAGAKPQVVELMAAAAPLHDIGKLGVPAEILRKREKLSAPDLERIRRHPQLGADIIGEHDDPLLKLARQIALTHHERWDGAGYPQGLKGEAIPWPGRVMAVVDAFESMTTTQFYRDPRRPEDAAADIERGAGTKYDPRVVEAFRRAVPAMQKVLASYSDALGDMINLDFAGKKSAAPRPETPGAPSKGASPSGARRK